ncbi:hypothetical protein L596_015720 [Steinernema carpocapsae]|uniref:Ground-like domain-containing protein n=1 Tax=Steinernema carpocapsae TaxID=34508 RepID=A0A4V6A367_STECR|nr:hypothetical protein L596_015720 [Steinernema carpocapsae]
MKSSSLLLALVVVASVVVVESFLFGGGGGGGGEAVEEARGCGGGGGGGGCGGGGGGGGCGGGCGKKRKKRSVNDQAQDDSDTHFGDSEMACTSEKLMNILKESIVEHDTDKSLVNVNEHLEHEMDQNFVAWCSDSMESFKFATRLESYCSHTNANVTCNIFHH